MLSAAGRISRAELGVCQPGMVVADRAGREVAEEVEDLAPLRRVVERRCRGSARGPDDVVAVDEDVPGERFAHLLRFDRRRRRELALHGRPRRGAASRGAGRRQVRQGGRAASAARPEIYQAPFRGVNAGIRSGPASSGSRSRCGRARTPWPGTSRCRRRAAGGSSCRRDPDLRRTGLERARERRDPDRAGDPGESQSAGEDVAAAGAEDVAVDRAADLLGELDRGVDVESGHCDDELVAAVARRDAGARLDQRRRRR